MDNKIIIAVDGHSSCGKSTLAKELAQKLDYIYIDTGAMYRAITLKFIDKKIPLDDNVQIQKLLDKTTLEFRCIEGENKIFLDGNDVEDFIRNTEVADMVSPVSEISQVRKHLVSMQQTLGFKKGLVMDGRDIGTVVFPTAELKLFITAKLDIRSQRRYLELKEKGLDIKLADIKRNLSKRDYIDSNRKDSPLKQADDAILIDTTHYNRKEQLELALKHALEKIESL